MWHSLYLSQALSQEAFPENSTVDKIHAKSD